MAQNRNRPALERGAASCYSRLMAEPETHDYMFLNGCDGGDLRCEETGLSSFDVDGRGLTEEEAKEKACELAERLAPKGGWLVAAVRVKEVFVVQYLAGEFVDRVADPIPNGQLPAFARAT